MINLDEITALAKDFDEFIKNMSEKYNIPLITLSYILKSLLPK